MKPKNIRKEITKALDQAEKLAPKRGYLDLGAKLTKSGVGATLQYNHRLKKNITAFANGDLVKQFDRRGLAPSLNAGIRFRF